MAGQRVLDARSAAGSAAVDQCPGASCRALPPLPSAGGGLEESPPPAAGDDDGVETGSPVDGGAELGAALLVATAEGLCDAGALGDDDRLGALLCAALVAGAAVVCTALGL
jgi:hypothetical protein